MECGADQSPVAAGSSEHRQILRARHTAAREEAHTREASAKTAQQLEIHTPSGSHPSHIEHEHRAHARGYRPGDQLLRLQRVAARRGVG